MSTEPSEADLTRILGAVRHIAVVGWSPNPARPSHYVSEFLAGRGYTVTAVNPEQAGRMVHGRAAVARLADIAEPVDMVDIFRAPAYIPDVVDEALALDPLPQVIWMQLGLRHDAAAASARAAGVTVVQNRCPKIEIPRLFPAGWTRTDAAV